MHPIENHGLAGRGSFGPGGALRAVVTRPPVSAVSPERRRAQLGRE
jgi:hypothetical protein